MAIQLDAVEQVGIAGRGGRQAAGRQGPGLPGCADRATGDRVAGGIANQAAGAVLGAVVPPADGEQRGNLFGDIHADLQLRLVLHRVFDAVGAVHQPRRAVRVAIRHGAADRHCRGRIATGLRGGVLHRLAVIVEPAEFQQPAEAALLVAQRGGGLVAVVVAAGAVRVAVILAEELGAHAGRQLPRQHGVDQHGAAQRVARVQRGIGPVQDVDGADFLGCHHAPARRAVPAVGHQVGEQQAVGIDQAARALQGTGVAAADHRVRIADVALAHHHVRRVFQRVGAFGDVLLLQLLPVDAHLHAGRLHHHGVAGVHRNRRKGGGGGGGFIGGQQRAGGDREYDCAKAEREGVQATLWMGV